MSWMADEWKSDLSHRALQKVEQLEGQVERFKKEAEIKQFKIDSIEQVIQKEKRRVEDEKSEVAALKREVQSLSESCQEIENKRQKCATDLQTRDSQINVLNGQIAHTKKLLDQETTKVLQLQTSLEKFECEQMGQDDKYEKLLADHEKLKQLNQHQVKDASALRTECGILKQKANDIENQLLSLQSENENLKTQLKNQTSGKDCEFKHLNEQLRLEKESLKLLDKKTTDEIKGLKNLLDAREKEIDKIQVEAKTKEDKLASVIKALTVEFQNFKEASSRKVSQESQAKTKLDQEIAELKGLLAEKEDENTKNLKDIKFLRDSLTNAQASVEMLKNDVRNKDGTIAQLRANSDSLQKDLDKQNRELLQANEKAEERVKKLGNELQMIKDENKNFENVILKKDKELADYRTDQKTIENEKDSLAKKVSGLENTKDKLSSTLSQMKTEMEKLISINNLQKREIEELKNTCTNKDLENVGMQKEIDHKNERLEASLKQLEITRKKCTELEDEHRQLQSQIETLETDYGSEKARLEGELKVAFERGNSVSDELEKMIKTKETLKTDFDQLSENMSNCKSELERMTLEKQEVDNIIVHKRSEIENLSKKINSLSEELNQVNSVKTNCEKAIEENNFVIDNLQIKVTELETKLSQSQEQKLQLDKSLELLKVKNDDLMETNRSSEVKLNELKAEFDEKKSLVQNYKENMEELNLVICGLKDELAVSKSVEEQTKVSLTQEIQKLEADCESKQKNIDDMNKEMHHKAERLEEAEKEITKLQTTNLDLNEKLADFEKVNQELQLHVDEKEKLTEKSISKTELLEQEISSLKDKMSEITCEITSTQGELHSKTEELASLAESKKAELNEILNELKHAQSEIEKLQRLNEELTENKLEAEQRMTSLLSANEENGSVIEELRIKSKDLSVVNDQLRTESQVWKEKFYSLDTEIGEHKANCQSEIEALKQNVQEKLSEAGYLQKALDEKSFSLEVALKNLDSASKEISDKNDLITLLERSMDEMKTEKEHADKIETEYSLKIQKLKADLKEVRDELSSKELDFSVTEASLKQNLAEMKNILEGKEKEIETAAQEMLRLNEHLVDLSGKHEVHMKEKEEFELKIKSMDREFEEKMHTLQDLQVNEQKLQSDVTQMNKEILSLKDELSDQSMDYSVNVAKLNQDIRELKNILEGKETDIESLKSENSIKMDELNKRQSALNDCNSKISDYCIRIGELEKNLEESQSCVNESVVREEASQNKLSQLQQELGEMKDRYAQELAEKSDLISGLRQENEELHNSLHGMNFEMDQLKSQQNIQASDIERIKGNCYEFEKLIAELKSQILEKDNELSSVQVSFHETTTKLDACQELITAIQAENQQLKDELSDFSIEESVQRAKYKHEMQALQDSYDAKCLEIKELEQQLIHKMQEIAKLQCEVDDGKKSHTEILEMFSALKLELDSTKSVCEKKDAEIEEKSSTISVLSQKLENRLTDFETAQNEKEQLKIEVTALREDIEIRDTKIQEKDEELKRSEERHNVILLENQNIKDSLENQTAEESANKAKLIQQVEELESVIEEKNIICSKLEAELSHVCSDLHDTKEKIIKCEQSISSLELDLNEKNSKLDELQSQISVYRQDIEKHVRRELERDKEIQQLKDDFVAKDAEREENVIKLKQEVEDLQSSVFVCTKENESLKQEILHNTEKYNKTTEDLLKSDEENSKMRAENISFRNKIDEIEFELANLKKVNDEKTEEINNFQKEIYTLKDKLSDIELEKSVSEAGFRQTVQELTTQIQERESKFAAWEKDLIQASTQLSQKANELESANKLNHAMEIEKNRLTSAVESLEYLLSNAKDTDEKSRGKISCLEAELSHTGEKLMATIKAQETLEGDFKCMLSEKTSIIEDYERQLKNVTNELNHKMEDFTKEQENVQRLQSKSSELEAEISSLNRMVDELSFGMKEAEKSKSVLISTGEDAYKIVTEKMKELDSLKKELEEHKLDLVEVKSSNAILQQEKESLMQTHDRERRELQTQISTLEANGKSMQEMTHDLEERFNKKSSQLQVSEENCEGLMAQNQDLSKRIDRLEKDNNMLEESVSKLTERLTCLDLEKINASRKLEEKQNILDALELELNTTKETMIQLQEKLSVVQEKFEMTENKLAHAESHRSTTLQDEENMLFVMQENTSKLEEEKRRLEESLSNLTETKDSLKKQIIELNDTLLLEQRQKDESQSRLHELKKEYDLSVSEIVNIKDEKEALVGDNLQLGEALTRMKDKEIDLKQHLDEANFKLECIASDMETLNEKNGHLENQAADFMQKNQELLKTQNELRTTINEQKKLVTELTEQLSEMERQKIELGEENDTMKIKLSELRDEAHAVEYETTSTEINHQSQIEENFRTIRLKEEEINRLKEQGDYLTNQIQETIYKKDAIEALLEEWKIKYSMLEKEKEELVFSSSSLREDNFKLQGLLQQRDQQIIEFKDRTSNNELESTITVTELKSIKKEAEIKLSQKSAEIDDARQQIIKLQDDLHNAELEVERLNKTVSDKTGDLVALEQKSTEAEWLLKDEIKTLKEEIEKNQKILSGIQNDTRRLEQEKLDLQHSYDSLDISMKNKIADLMQGMKENEDLLEKLERLEVDKTEYITTIERLEKELCACKADNALVEQRLADISGDLVLTKSLSQNLQSQLEEVDTDCKSLQEKIYLLTKEKEELEMALKQSTDEKHRIELELKDYTSAHSESISKLTKDNETLEQTILTLENILKNKDREINDLQNKQEVMEELKKCNSEKCQKIGHQEETIQTLSEKLESYEMEKINIDSRLQDLVSEKLALEKSLQAYQQETANKSNEIDILSLELAETKENLSGLLKEKSNIEFSLKEMKEEVMSLSDICEQKQSSIAKLEVTVCELKEELTSKEKVKKETDRELRRLQSDLEQLETKYHHIEAEKQELESMVEFTSMDSTSKEDQIVSMQKQLDELVHNNNTLEKKLRDTKDELQIKSDKLAEIEDSMTLIQTEKKNIEEDLIQINSSRTANATLIDDLKNQLKDAKYELDNVKDLFEALEFENSSLETEKSNFEKKLELLQDDLNNKEQEINELQISKLQKETNDRTLYLNIQQTLSEEKEKLKNKIEELTSEVNKLEMDLNSRSQVIADLQEEKLVLVEKLDTFEMTVSSMESQKADADQLQKDLNSATAKINVLEEKVSLQEKEKSDLLAKFLTLEDKLSGSEKACKNLNKLVEELRTERQTTENKLAELQINTDKLMSEIMTVQTKYEELLQANTDMEKKLSTKQKELEQAKQSLKNNSQNHTSLLKVVKMLKEKNGSLEDKVLVLETDKIEHIDKLKQLEGCKTELDERVKNSDRIKTDLENKVKTLESLLAEKDNKMKLSRSDLMSPKTYKVKVNQMQTELENLRKQVEMNNKREKNNSSNGSGLSKEEIQAMQEKTRKLQEELEASKKEAGVYLDKYHALTKRYSQLESNFINMEQRNQPSNTKIREGDGTKNNVSPVRSEVIKESFVVTQPVSTLAEERSQQPAAKKQKNGDNDEVTAVPRLIVEEEKTPKRKSPRLASQPKSSTATVPSCSEHSKGLKKQASDFSVLINMTGNQSQNSAISKGQKAVKQVPAKTGPKGLRPTLKLQKSDNEKSAVSLQCDMDTNSVNKTMLTDVSSKIVKGQSETVTSVNKYSLTSKPLTGGQLKTENSQSVSKKPLETITNSPVKRAGTSDCDLTAKRVVGPQRTLSLKKASPVLLKSRRAKEEMEEQNSLTENDKEGDPECKVS